MLEPISVIWIIAKGLEYFGLCTLEILSLHDFVELVSCQDMRTGGMGTSHPC